MFDLQTLHENIHILTHPNLLIQTFFLFLYNFSFSTASLSLFKMALACKASSFNLDIAYAESFLVLQQIVWLLQKHFWLLLPQGWLIQYQ